MVRQKDNRCPCESGQLYGQCCGPYIEGLALPETAEALMRSRYCAYVEENDAYLRSTWHPDFCPDSVAAIPGQKWLGLKVRATQAGGPMDQTGIVEFVARFKIEGRGHRLHEISQFVKVDGHWLYTEGELKNPEKFEA